MTRTPIAGLFVAALLGTSLAAQAAPAPVSITPLLTTGVTVAGAPITYPKTDSAEVAAIRLEISPGGETGRHMHPYPTIVYVLEGQFEVEMDGGAVHTYKAGDCYVEATNTWHNSRNKGTTVAKAFIVFVGVHGKPNAVRP